MTCRPCQRRVVEQGNAVYLNKTAVLHNGLVIKITNYDPEDARRFAGMVNGGLLWFRLSDVEKLRD